MIENGASQGLSRRGMLKAGLAAGGGLIVSISLPSIASAQPVDFAPSAFIRIGSNGKIVLTMPYVEMGQGTYTSVPMLIAEELEVELGQITLEHAPPDEKHFGNPILSGLQLTGGSTTIRAAWQPMRQAGAATRTMLIAAAAKRWNVDPTSCRAQKGVVIHVASGRKLGYGELAEAAAALPIPQNIPLKGHDEFRLIGTRAKRLDTPAKVNGSAVYGIDVRPVGVKIATLAQSPTFGGRLKSVDDIQAKAVRGVRQIVVLDDAVAVVADHMGAAKKGLAALKINWDDGPHANLSTEEIARDYAAALQNPGAVVKAHGEAVRTVEAASNKVTAQYQVPFLAHAALEPMNCTVHVRKNECEIWVGNQVMARAQAAAAQVTGLPADRITVHNHLIGGGFGRRLEVDGITRAVQIARQVEGPVKVVWTREEDIQHDMYRPFFSDTLTAAVDDKGMPIAWHHRFTGSSVLGRYIPPAFKNGFDPETVDGAAHLIYELPNFQLEYIRKEPPGIPTAFWRSVGPSHNVFVVESFIDELAAAAQRDPIAYRRALLGNSPRARAVLDLAAEKSGWGNALPKGTGRGVSLQFAFGTYFAAVADVAVGPKGDVHVKRVVCALDCGSIINPDTVEAQAQGAIIFGISAALYGEITLKNGRVEQSNFDNYEQLRIDAAPAIEVHTIRNGEAPGGMGEPGTCAIMPAIANAIFAATGKRLRKLPIDSAVLKQS